MQRTSFTRRGALGVGAAALALALSACGASGGDATTATPDPENPVVVKVGANPVPHARILEFVDENLAQQAGIDLEIQEFDDYQLPNTALDEGSIDANFYMHGPFFEAQVRDRNLEMEHGEGVHIEPYAAFSRQIQSVD
ncbi:MAG: ABC transporter, partial [Kocuria rhizophila]